MHGLNISGTVKIYVSSYCTLTCNGAHSNGFGGAGILVNSGNNLYLYGRGTVNASGANAGPTYTPENGRYQVY